MLTRHLKCCVAKKIIANNCATILRDLPIGKNRVWVTASLPKSLC